MQEIYLDNAATSKPDPRTLACAQQFVELFTNPNKSASDITREMRGYLESARAKVAEFRNKMGYSFPMGLDIDQSVFKKFATNYIPRNFLVGRDGTVVKVSVGYDEAEFAELIKSIEEAVKK